MRSMKIYNICLSWKLWADELGMLSTVEVVVVFLTSPSALFPKPDNSQQQGEETSCNQLFAALKAEGVRSILSVTLHLARDEE